jgi:hypothetical protein
LEELKFNIPLFLSKIDKARPGGCWDWSGVIMGTGYGAFSTQYRKSDMLTHRLSWMLHCGPIPDKLLVLHKCDRRCCVNPDHLFLGTHKDNADDAMKKGRLRGLIKPGQRIHRAPNKYAVYKGRHGCIEVACAKCQKVFWKREDKAKTHPDHRCSRSCNGPKLTAA